jgi:hypothetical protein
MHRRNIVSAFTEWIDLNHKGPNYVA